MMIAIGVLRRMACNRLKTTHEPAHRLIPNSRNEKIKDMNCGIQHLFKTAALVGVLAVGLTACEGPTEVAESDDAALELATSLVQELDLSSSQEQSLQAGLDGDGDRMHTPGALWYLAARLQENLTEEQKAAFFERAAAMTDACAVRGDSPFGRGHGLDFRRHDHAPRFTDGLAHHLFWIINDLLTEEQRAAIEALLARYREQFAALVEAFRNERVVEEEFRAELAALRAALREALYALLTDEQRAELEARLEEKQAEVEARRDALQERSRAAMFEVLGLTGDDAEAVAAILDETAVEREALVEQAQNGAIDAETLAAALQELHDSERAELQLLLDPAQWDIVEIHDALAVRMGCGFRRAHPGHRNGSGYTGPTGGAFGFD